MKIPKSILKHKESSDAHYKKANTASKKFNELCVEYASNKMGVKVGDVVKYKNWANCNNVRWYHGIILSFFTYKCFDGTMDFRIRLKTCKKDGTITGVCSKTLTVNHIKKLK